MDAMKVALTKDYVTGIHFEGPFIHDHCVPCLVGKSPQRSYPYRGHRATKANLCIWISVGLFPFKHLAEKMFFSTFWMIVRTGDLPMFFA